MMRSGIATVGLLPRGWRSKLLTSFGWDFCIARDTIGITCNGRVHREGGPCRTSELEKLDMAAASAKYRFIEVLSVSYLI
jgi:hypothetical protein